MTRKVPHKLFFVNIRLFLMEVLIIFVTIVFLMAKQAEFYGADLVKESGHYIGWYLLYWGIAVFAAVSVITFTRYFFIDRPIKQLSMATMQVASGDFSIRLRPYPLSSKSGYINVMYQDFNKMVAPKITKPLMILPYGSSQAGSTNRPCCEAVFFNASSRTSYLPK